MSEKVLNRELVLALLKSCGGNITRVAREAGVARRSVRTFVELHGLQKEVERARKRRDDRRVEVALKFFDKALAQGERWAVIRVLETIGRGAGLGRDGRRVGGETHVHGNVNLVSLTLEQFRRLPAGERLRLSREARITQEPDRGGPDGETGASGVGEVRNGHRPLDQPLVQPGGNANMDG